MQLIRPENWFFLAMSYLLMVVFTCDNVKTDLAKIWNKLVNIQQAFDRKVMQDLEIQSCCVLSSIFMMLCGVCMAMVLLIAIGFALDEVDIKYAAQVVASFLRKF